MRDAAQAYIQASIVGPGRPATWVRLPRPMWPPEWLTKDGKPVYSDPVVPLPKALYGHPESGALWEKHLASILITLGWKKCESHPGIWIHVSGAVLAAYVDDLLMVAPRDQEVALWAAIASKVSFDEVRAPIGKFLGANHVFKKDGKYVHHPHRRDGRLQEGRGGDLCHGDRSYEARRGTHALPAREHLGLRTEGK